MELTPWLTQCPLVAILRGVKPEEAVAIGAALERQGVVIVEVPLNSPRPMESIALLAREFGERLLIGAGTVMTTTQVTEIAAAGGKLIVTPHADAAIVRTAKLRGLLSVPGFFTPSEAFAMLAAGADGLKLFPSEAASPAVLRALRAVLPAGTAVLPVGGIDASNMAAWRAAGAAGFGIGSAIYKPGDSPETVGAKAHALVERRCRPSADAAGLPCAATVSFARPQTGLRNRSYGEMPMTDPVPFRPLSPGTQPPYDAPAYRGTIKRHPKQKLHPLPQTITEPPGRASREPVFPRWPT